MKLIQFVLLLVTSFYSCRQVATKNKIKTAATELRDTISQHDRDLFKEFSVRKGATELRIRDWKQTLNLQELGTPRDTSGYVLGDGADTHRGSIIRNYVYDDIHLQFFGPPQGKDVWLVNMELTASSWSTARGIRVGDPEAKMKKAYPEATNEFSGDKNIYRYTVNESEIEFILRSGNIKSIKISYLIP
jgi:hypothetical protein